MRMVTRAAFGCAVGMSLAGFGVAAAQAPAVEERAESMTEVILVELTARDGSTASGNVVIEGASAGETALSFDVSGVPVDAELSALLVSGTCEEPGELRAALGVIETTPDGEGNATLQVAEPLEALLSASSAVRVQAIVPGGDGAELLCGQLAYTEEVSPAPVPAPEPAVPSSADEPAGEEDADEAADPAPAEDAGDAAGQAGEAAEES
jgi:hypothetical protein